MDGWMDRHKQNVSQWESFPIHPRPLNTPSHPVHSDMSFKIHRSPLETSSFWHQTGNIHLIWISQQRLKESLREFRLRDSRLSPSSRVISLNMGFKETELWKQRTQEHFPLIFEKQKLSICLYFEQFICCFNLFVWKFCLKSDFYFYLSLKWMPFGDTLFSNATAFMHF